MREMKRRKMLQRSGRGVLRFVPLRWSAAAILAVFLACPHARLAAAQAMAEYGHATATAAASTSGAQPVKIPASPHLAPRTGEGLDVINRRTLEQRAGKDAAKLTLKSVPAKASVRIDGKVVGYTPLILTLAPGDYKLEMEGERMELARRQLSVAPRESREVELSLETRYPTHVKLH